MSYAPDDSTALTIIEPHQSTLPPAPDGWERAPLPLLYRQACDALRRCLKIDECMEWKRKADAFASYYRQAVDKGPYNMALRIRLRAWRRCGEMFLELDAAMLADSNPTSHSRNGKMSASGAAAREHGIGYPDRARAIALASIPLDEFEARLAEEPPPSLAKLAPMTAYPQYGQTPEGRACASVIHSLVRILNVVESYAPEVIAAQVTADNDGSPMMVGMVRRWLDQFEAAHLAQHPAHRGGAQK